MNLERKIRNSPLNSKKLSRNARLSLRTAIRATGRIGFHHLLLNPHQKMMTTSIPTTPPTFTLSRQTVKTLTMRMTKQSGPSPHSIPPPTQPQDRAKAKARKWRTISAPRLLNLGGSLHFLALLLRCLLRSLLLIVQCFEIMHWTSLITVRRNHPRSWKLWL